MTVRCVICEKELKNERLLTIHLQKEHQLSRKDYADLYLKVDNICPFCGKEKAFQNTNYMRTCNSKECIVKLKQQIYLERYGVINPGQREEQKEINRHNFDDPEILAERNRKTKETSLKRYGVESPNQNADVKERIRLSMQEKYGVDCGFQLQQCKDKAFSEDAIERRKHTLKKNCLEKYGVDNVSKLPEIIQKIKDTKQERYGDPSFCNFEKAKSTMFEKYGVEHYAQSEDFAKLHRSVVYYDGYNFDSIPEMELYKFCKDNNLTVEVKPVRIPFLSSGKTHYYFPDFLIEGVLFEYKGKHLIKYDEDNQICGLLNPYVSKLSEEENKIAQQYQMDKYECIKQNNVYLITDTNEFDCIKEIVKTYRKTKKEEKEDK